MKAERRNFANAFDVGRLVGIGGIGGHTVAQREIGRLGGDESRIGKSACREEAKAHDAGRPHRVGSVDHDIAQRFCRETSLRPRSLGQQAQDG